MFDSSDFPKLELVRSAAKIRNGTAAQLNGCASSVAGGLPKPPVVEFWQEQDIKLGVVNDTPSNAIYVGPGIQDLRGVLYTTQSYIRMQVDLERQRAEVTELRAFIARAIELAKTI